MSTATLASLAALVGGKVEGNEEIMITGAATLGHCQDGDITLADTSQLIGSLDNAPASAVVVSHGFPPTLKPRIVVDDVHEAFSRIVSRFRPPHESPCTGCSDAAHIASSARIATDVIVHPFATVGPDVVIESGATVHSGVRIMAGGRIGPGVVLFPNVVLYPGTVIGARSILHGGATIGGYGFGYQPVDGVHVRGAQLGHVEIGRDVEIGAGTTIDRGTYDATTIGDGTKIDNQVMIGHNCRIGKHNLICSQVGIAGSCTTGDYVVMAGQVGLSDHLYIGHRAILGAKAGVMNDVPNDAVFIGIPATPERDQWRMWGHVRQLPNMRRQLKRLQKQWEQMCGAELEHPKCQDAA
ncbi:MAG: UDP-3-O-(3-hydroxymyristoyl)glucosamine N-acyltransferase [Planctomycetota bacterium]